MAKVTMNGVEIYLDARTTEAWGQVTRVIPKGFPCIELADDNKIKMKVGDGVNTYDKLPYVGGDIDLSNYYNKSETDEAISAAITDLGTLLNLKGRVDNVEALPPSDNKKGDVYLVGEAEAREFKEYYWTDTMWDYMGFTTEVDLSDYYKKSEVDDLLKKKVDVRAGYDLSKNDFTDELKNKLEAFGESDEYIKTTDTLILNCQLSEG